ncbi:MAG: DUF2484 family protein [Rhodobacteraceae bacterium]|nr:DUF2484 family protein [Paracoccaceae bacterium]
MTAILAASLWALAVNLVAMIPWGKLHFSLGFMLLLCFPYVLWLVAQAFGGWAVFAIVLVGLSLYRLPLAYYLKKAYARLLGRAPE